MKALTERQAKNCEEAREPACDCRCGGRAHGAKRGGGNASMEFYHTLPEDDPHYTPSPTKRYQLQQEKCEAKRKERQERIDVAEKAQQDALTAVYTARRDGNYDLASKLHEKFMEASHHAKAVRKSKDGIVVAEEAQEV